MGFATGSRARPVVAEGVVDPAAPGASKPGRMAVLDCEKALKAFMTYKSSIQGRASAAGRLAKSPGGLPKCIKKSIGFLH